MTRHSLIRNDTATACEEAFVFAYPLVLMELSRLAMTSVSAPDPGTMRAPPNRLVHAPGRPDSRTLASSRAAMLRSSAWLDVAEQPLVLSVPETHGRYSVMSMIDMWTNAFASVGAPTTGTRAAGYAVGLPGVSGLALPPGVLPIAAPTRHMRVVGQTCVGKGEPEAEARAIQHGYHLCPLSQRRDQPAAETLSARDHTLSPELIDHLDARTFFGLACRLLAEHPPRGNDLDVMDRAAELGLFTARDDAWVGYDPALLRAVERGVVRGRAAVRARAASGVGELCDGWRVDYRRGRYGTDYLSRAAAAGELLDADVSVDALHARTRTDADGRRLSGRHRYLLRFCPDVVPPVHGFWALTVKGGSISLGDLDGLTADADGSLPIHIQQERPARPSRSNWLPTPPGDFMLVLRLHWPRGEVLRRRWTPPPVARVG